MIEPAPLADLIAADPVSPVKAAIVARLKALLPGVTVQSHPGKVDISDIVQKTVVAAPGVAVGWSKARILPMPDGGWHAVIDWTAYVVTDDRAIDNRRVERDQVANAIGLRLLKILGDPDEQLWQIAGITPPEAVDFKPFFTVKDVAQGMAYYAVTWRQTVVALGAGLWADLPTGQVTQDGTIQFDGEDEMVAAMKAAGFGIPGSDDQGSGS